MARAATGALTHVTQHCMKVYDINCHCYCQPLRYGDWINILKVFLTE